MRHALLFTLLLCLPLQAAEYWISPNGNPHAAGSRQDPWDLATALAQPLPIAPGDVLLLQAGLYQLQQPLVSRLTGLADRPIHLRAQGRVSLDCAAAAQMASNVSCLLIQGAHAWYEGFEIFNSSRVRRTSASGSAVNPRGTGLESRSGPGVKLINLVIHDVGLALFESQPSGIEIYGLIAYNNGWDAPDRSHGPGIYIRNRTAWPRKFIQDSIVFQNYRQGLQGYGTGPNVFSRMQLSGNVFFNNGIGRDGFHRNFMFGNENSDHVDNVFWENFTYFAGSGQGGNLFGGVGGCRGLRLIGNVFAHGPNGSAAQLACLSGVEASENVFYGKTVWEGAAQTFQAAFPDNRYPQSPSGVDVRLRRNRYDSQRLHAVVYNWDRADAVPLDLAAAHVPLGAHIEIRSAQDPFGEPLRFIYEGEPLAVPMHGWTPALPIGWTADRPLPPTFPEFGALIVTWVRAGLARY